MRISDIFLEEHKLRASDIDMEDLVQVITSDMVNGLAGKDSSLSMIPTYIEAENDFLTGVPVLAIDAGGTNFRASLISFSRSGRIKYDQILNYRMPGLDREISAKEFFRTIADYVRPLSERTERIGFCFSYPTEILPNRDGRLIQFCKEVQVPEVVGQLIGKNLLETLGTPEKHLVLLNDTVATLLAGKSASLNKSYDSFIGYILGTGTNTCYIESNSNIVKNPGLDPGKSHIINIESGNFGKTPRTDLDISFDNSTVNSGNYTFEKMISGGYIGGLCVSVLKSAAEEGIFSKATASNILSISHLTSEDVHKYVSLKAAGHGPLQSCLVNKTDEEYCTGIIESIIARAAKLVAANLAAVILKTNRGKTSDRPVLITIEGTTFYKLHNLKTLFEKYFREYLSGERQRFYEFTEVHQSSLIGAALAALIN